MQRRFRLAAVLLTLLPSSSTGAAAEVARGTLREVSLRFVEVFNANDGAALRQMLAAEQRDRRQADELGMRLAECHRRFGTLERIGLPVMGTRTYGLIAAHFEGFTRDLFLEIDTDGKVEVPTIAGPDGSCSLAGPQLAGP